MLPDLGNTNPGETLCTMPNVRKHVCVKLWKCFPYVLFETNRLQYLNLPGTDAEIIYGLRKANPKKWFGEVRYNSHELFVTYIDDFVD